MLGCPYFLNYSIIFISNENNQQQRKRCLLGFLFLYIISYNKWTLFSRCKFKTDKIVPDWEKDQRSIQNLVKHLRLNFFAKIIHGFQLLAIFGKSPNWDVRLGSDANLRIDRKSNYITTYQTCQEWFQSFFRKNSSIGSGSSLSNIMFENASSDLNN